MTELVFTTCVLAVVIVGMLVMTQAISLEQVGHGIWRGFLFLALGFITVWLTKAILLPILLCGLVWLKNKMLWGLLIVLVVITAMFLLRLLALKLATRELRSKRDIEE